MESLPRHQCLIYEGAPSRHLPAIAAVVRDNLQRNYRCLYLNSPPMVAGLRSYLAAAGLDVTHEIDKASLVLSSEQRHLAAGRFDLERMIHTLEDTLRQALSDGYDGLWATGDMTWEMGPEKNFAHLLEYEWRLEDFFHSHPQISGICQYHADSLPRQAMRKGLVSHRCVFLNETLSILNPHYVRPETLTDDALGNPLLDSEIQSLYRRAIGI